MPWLATSHRVVEQAPGDYAVHLHAGNQDTARYVASTIGDALGRPSMDIHYPDYRQPDLAGVKYVGDTATVDRIQSALAADGHPTIKGTTGTSLQIPLYDQASMQGVAASLRRIGIDPASLERYNGANERITSDAYARHVDETGGRFAPTTAERRGLLERARGAPAEGQAAVTTGAGPPDGAAAETGAGPPSPSGRGLLGALESRAPGQRTTRMFHGTGADFATVDPTKVSGEANLFGPGDDVTSDPRVAGGVVQPATEPLTATQQSLVDRGLLSPENARSRAGAVLQPGYAQNAVAPDSVLQQLQARLATFQTQADQATNAADRSSALKGVTNVQRIIDKTTFRGAGPNVRALDVPSNLNLFDADKPVAVNDARNISNAITDPEVQRRFDIRVFPNDDRAATNGLTGDQVYQALVRAGDGSKAAVNRVLADAGFDGITYNGGQRVPMTDAAGMPIEHQATVIFPQSVGKVRNALSGQARWPDADRSVHAPGRCRGGRLRR